MPPVLVRMPCAAHMPPTSSGLVSWRTRITFSAGFALTAASAAAASNTILPTPAPGPAGRPLVNATAFFSAATSKIGNSSCSRSEPDSVQIASSGLRILSCALPV